MEPLSSLPEASLIRLPTVLKHLQISRSHFYQGIKDGIHPAPVHHGRIAFWRSDDIRALIAKISGNVEA